MTTVVSFNKTVKKVATSGDKAIARMESALAPWIIGRRQKNISLDTNTIRTKVKYINENVGFKSVYPQGDASSANEAEFEELSKLSSRKGTISLTQICILMRRDFSRSECRLALLL